MSEPLIVCVVGSRRFPRRDKVVSFIRRLWVKHPDCIVLSGGAPGVDTWAVEEARSCGLKTRVMRADWDRFGYSAGYKRNEDMIPHCQILVAFWDGQSRGTRHAIGIARHLGKRTLVYGPAPEPGKELPEPSPCPSAEAAARARADRQRAAALAEARAAAAPRERRRDWWDHELGEGADRPLPRETVYLPDQAPEYRHYSDALTLIARLGRNQ